MSPDTFDMQIQEGIPEGLAYELFVQSVLAHAETDPPPPYFVSRYEVSSGREGVITVGLDIANGKGVIRWGEPFKKRLPTTFASDGQHRTSVYPWYSGFEDGE